MSNFEDIIPLILNKKFAHANELLEQRLYKKLGKTLEESLLEYAPSVFMNQIEKEAYFTALDEAKKKMKKKPDADGDGVPDWADKKEGEDDNEEDDTEVGENKKGMKASKGEKASKMDEDVELFLNELTELVEEIENELGEELTEEEIAEIAEELISEEIDPDEDEEEFDEDEDEFEDDGEEEICESCGE